MKEFDLIARLERRCTKLSPSVEIGIGDDAAVVAAGGGMRFVFTTDAMVEGVHFDRKYGTWHQLGRRALAINLSDLAAMGADARYTLVALGLPQDMDNEFFDAFFDGLEELAQEHRVSLVGGNLSRSPVLTITITAIGCVAGPALTRSGGNPGDRLLVTGPLGSSALGLTLLKSGTVTTNDDERELQQCHLNPRPQLAIGAALRLIATACIDISDGLAQDTEHLARSSKCGATIELEKLPLSPAYHRLTESMEDRWQPALAGGEDYELLLTVPPLLVKTAQMTANQVGGRLFDIGCLTQGQGTKIIDAQGNERPLPSGWNHF